MRLTLLALVVLCTCAEVDSPNPKMALPADYRTAYVQVRQCQNSIEHNLMDVVVRVRSDQVALYETGPYPFPQGSVVVKEEYRAQGGCTDLVGYTVMRKESAGYFPEGGDWQWFSLDSYGTVLKDGRQPACSHCHALPMCRGRDFVCSQP
jgi:hypothetical protein